MAGPLANTRHERFAQELAKGCSQTDAYTAAGYNGDRTAASRLATKVNIQSRVEELLAGAAEKAEITQARVLAELGKIGFADIRRMFNDSGQLRRIEDLDDEASASLAAVEVITRRVPGSPRDDPEYENVHKIKLWDKRAALVDIGKHLGMFTEKHEITGKDGAPIEVSLDEAARRIAFMLSAASK